MTVTDISEARERLRKKKDEDDDVGPCYSMYVYRIPETEEHLYRFIVEAPEVMELIILGNTDDPDAFDYVTVRDDQARDGVIIFDVKMKKPVVNHMVQFFPEDDVVECILFVKGIDIVSNSEEEIHEIWEWLAGWFTTD